MRCFLWLILTTLTTAAAIAQKTKGGTVDNTVTKTTPRIFSLVVGISNYAQLPKLDFADRDAKAFRDYLVTVQGVPANRVFCLTNDSATNLNIFDRLYQLSDSLKAGDQFLFYFSGHGDWESKISDNSLLLLRNAPMQNYLRYPDQFINSQTLNAFLRKLSEQNVTTVLIADACRSGNLIGGKEGSQTTVLQLKQGFKNSIRILSCMPDELSFESAKWGGGRGVFSYYLTLGLMGIGKGDPAGSVDLTLGELRNYLEENVRRETNGKQNPVLEGDSRMVMARVDKASMATAKLQAEANKSTTSLVSRGKGTIDTTSAKYKALLKLFAEQVQRGNLTVPVDQSAFVLYKQLLQFVPEAFLDEQRNSLLARVSADFSRYSENYYNGEPFPMEELTTLKSEVEAAMKLTAKKPFLHDRFYSNQLFLHAGILLYDAKRGTLNISQTEVLKTAIDSLEKAVTLTPHEPYLFRMLGNSYLPLNPAKAIEYFNHYVALLPNDAGAYNAIGVAYFVLKQYTNAVAPLKKAIRLNGKNPRYYYNLGMCYRAMGKEAEANQMFKKSQQINQPDDRSEL